MKTGVWRGLVVLAVLWSFAASAGASWVYPYCTKAADGSGYCSGSFEAFRKSADSLDYATFYSSDNGFRYFFASLNGGLYYSCTASYGSEVYVLWPTAMASSGAFLIQWNKAGMCTGLTLYNGSPYRSGW